jgi:hypothetical protein
VEGASFRLADEVGYIQRPAAAYDGRIVTVGQLVLFSTDTGDAWLLDRSDRLAARLARDGEPEPIQIEESDTAFTIGWKGRYRLDGPAFVYSDQETGRVVTILRYPTERIADATKSVKFQICLASIRACRQLSKIAAEARWTAARKLRAVLS